MIAGSVRIVEQSDKRMVELLVDEPEDPLMPGAGVIDALAHAAVSIRRSTTAEQVAESLDGRSTNGALPPGTPLREEAVIGALGVSRSTSGRPSVYSPTSGSSTTPCTGGACPRRLR
jgi:hypothetical protein